MIKARHNKLYIWFFWTYFRMMRKIYFRKMTVIDDFRVPDNQAVLLFQNHFSWYDGYFSYHLCRNVFKRRFNVMMLEDQLRKRMFLNRTGIFSIRKNNRDAVESLRYSAELLADPKNLVTVYPSGELLSHHWQTFTFQGGINRIISGATDQFAIVLVVVLIDYFSLVRPEIRIYLENYSGERTAGSIEKAYQSFYQSCVKKQVE